MTILTTVDLFKARNRLSELVERAARGAEIIISRRGAQVARLMPPHVLDALGQAHALAARIRKSRADQPAGDGAPIRALIDEGRR